MKHHHNTTNLEGNELAAANKKAATQETIVLNYMMQHKESTFTADDLHSILFKSNVPLTSVRRAMSNLQSDGKVTKTNTKRIGTFGAKVFAWKLAIQQSVPKLPMFNDVMAQVHEICTDYEKIMQQRQIPLL